MKKKLIIVLTTFIFIAVSCGRECDVSTGKTINMDLSSLPLSGEFQGLYGNMKISFPNDTTAVLSYKENGNLYELTYQIDTTGQYYEVYETKYVN